jgi:curli biogenesis system outer membrane secretion channel CsgG
MRAWTLFLFSCLSALAACGTYMVPLVAPQHSRERMLVQREFRLGTFNFGRAGGDTHELGSVVPAMLLTALREGGRFAIYEGGNIRSTGEPVNEHNASDYMDGYLSGTFTTLDNERACLDLRVSNAVTQEVLYSKPVCIPVTVDGRVDRDTVKRIAEEITLVIKQIGNGKVTSSDARMVFCNKGRQAGVRRGMVAYIVGTADTVTDPTIHREVQRYTGVDPAELVTVGTPIIVGEMYVVSVEDEYSVGLLHKGDYVLPGDTVFFK